MSRKLNSSSTSTWQTINLHTSRVTKDLRRRRRPFVTFRRQRVCLTSFSFATSFLRARCKRTTICWTTSTRSRHSQILACLEVHVRNENIVMTLLESLSTLFEYLITVIKTMSMKEFIMEYVLQPLLAFLNNFHYLNL